MSYDLNIPWPVNNYDKSPTLQQLTNLRNIIITNYSLGITHQAINFQISIESVKIPIGNEHFDTLTFSLSSQFSILNSFEKKKKNPDNTQLNN